MIGSRVHPNFSVALLSFLVVTATTGLASAQQVPPPQYDGKGKTYRVLPGSNLRKGDTLTSGVVVTLWQGGTIVGSGPCTQQSCPVTYNTQELFARRSRLRIDGGPVPTPGACGTISRRLERGADGDDVKRMQEALNRNGAAITADGNFGRGTEAAVTSFQKAKGLTADGVAGKGTLTALGCTPSY